MGRGMSTATVKTPCDFCRVPRQVQTIEATDQRTGRKVAFQLCLSCFTSPSKTWRLRLNQPKGQTDE